MSLVYSHSRNNRFQDLNLCREFFPVNQINKKSWRSGRSLNHKEKYAYKTQEYKNLNALERANLINSLKIHMLSLINTNKAEKQTQKVENLRSLKFHKEKFSSERKRKA